jgi:hypothetical protein
VKYGGATEFSKTENGRSSSDEMDPREVRAKKKSFGIPAFLIPEFRQNVET